MALTFSHYYLFQQMLMKPSPRRVQFVESDLQVAASFAAHVEVPSVVLYVHSSVMEKVGGPPTLVHSVLF
jgi:hypothetical protein